MPTSICVRQPRVNLRDRRPSRGPRANDPCPACNSTDTFVYHDPQDGRELVCMDCIRYEIAEAVEG